MRGPLEPRRRLQTLEHLERLGQKRLGLFGAAPLEQPLGMLELRDRKPEQNPVLAEDLLRGLEALLDGVVLRTGRGEAGPEPRGLGAQERRLSPPLHRPDLGDEPLPPRPIFEPGGGPERLQVAPLYGLAPPPPRGPGAPLPRRPP